MTLFSFYLPVASEGSRSASSEAQAFLFACILILGETDHREESLLGYSYRNLKDYSVTEN